MAISQRVSDLRGLSVKICSMAGVRANVPVRVSFGTDLSVAKSASLFLFTKVNICKYRQ